MDGLFSAKYTATVSEQARFRFGRGASPVAHEGQVLRRVLCPLLGTFRICLWKRYISAHFRTPWYTVQSLGLTGALYTDVNIKDA